MLQPTLMDLAPALARVTEGTPEAELRLARMKQYDVARQYFQLLQVFVFVCGGGGGAGAGAGVADL